MIHPETNEFLSDVDNLTWNRLFSIVLEPIQKFLFFGGIFMWSSYQKPLVFFETSKTYLYTIVFGLNSSYLGTCTTGIEVFSIKNQILLKYTHKFKLPFNVFLWFILPPYANRWPFIYLIARCIFDIRINYYAISFFKYKMHGGAIILRFCIDKMTWVEQPNI